MARKLALTIALALLWLAPVSLALVPDVAVPESHCGEVPAQEICVPWTRVARGSDLCGVQASQAIWTKPAWDAFWARASWCYEPRPAQPAVDLARHWIAFSVVAHHDCCDHNVDTIDVLLDDGGYRVVFLHREGSGGSDMETAPFDLIAVERVDVAEAAAFERFDAPWVGP